MKALLKERKGQGHVVLAERPEPTISSGQALLEVVGAGVCGTDLHIHDDEFSYSPPVVMGHEVSGVVIDVADKRDSDWVGARVVCETYFETCGECVWCVGGRRNLCPSRRSIGSRVDGGFAERLAIPVANLHRIPDWLDGHSATLLEPLACVCNCLSGAATPRAGDEVTVIGPGPVGLLASQVAQAAGATVRVIGTPRDEARLEVAHQLGLATALADVATAIEPSWVIECSGSPAGISSGLKMIRRGGRFVQIGLAGRPVLVPLDEVCFKELSVTSGNASTRSSWLTALELVETRQVSLDPLVSEVVGLKEWSRVFADIRSAIGLKHVFDPRLS